MTDNQNWLAEYVRTESDASFRELVTCYVDLVYSTALRLVCGDTHRAEDVAQTVFVNLARVARTLPKDVKLGGWLHRDTCFTASTLMRGERRRQSRERQAAEMNALQSNSEADYSLVAPVLDEAINELDEADRTAILLRFFEQHDFRSVGQALGSNEDAARMRVTRALDKLEGLIKRRGVTMSAAALSVVLSANAVQAAPVGLAVMISTAASAAGAVAVATTATHTAMNWINIKPIVAIGASALVAGTSTHLVHQRETNRLRNDNQNLVAERDKSASERDAALSVAKATNDELERLQKNQNELLRLRGETGILRSQLSELEKLRAENRHLRELQSTTAENVAKPESDPEFAYRKQKGRAAKILAGALIGYAVNNQQQFLVDFGQVAPYLAESLRNDLNPGDVLRDVADFAQVTNQFDIVYQGKWNTLTNRGETIVLREKQPWQNGGKWRKAYGFADGRSEVVAEPPEGFEAWERQRMVLPPPADR